MKNYFFFSFLSALTLSFSSAAAEFKTHTHTHKINEGLNKYNIGLLNWNIPHGPKNKKPNKPIPQLKVCNTKIVTGWVPFYHPPRVRRLTTHPSSIPGQPPYPLSCCIRLPNQVCHLSQKNEKNIKSVFGCGKPFSFS